ncbi:thioredoxin domain-containing protein [Mariniblastus sp.]|nr:thioredoxin domain-containing protein [Mariniblastus sp.]
MNSSTLTRTFTSHAIRCNVPKISTILIVLVYCLGCTSAQEPTKSKAQTKTQSEQTQNQQSSEKHDDDGKHQHNNALAKESSPYLLMHAHNPVDWRAWNEETLALAKKEDKPIFLSIGYSSCHWCHVMERESFLDKEIAEFLNKHFICIKVDREERPDVDEIYMRALSIVSNQGGGWPLSMFLMPDGRPFLGGTYFPARDGDRPGLTGFLTVIRRVDSEFKNNRDSFEQIANQATKQTKQALAGRAPLTETKIQATWTTETISDLKDRFDPDFGGFGYSPNNARLPKFPEPSNLLFFIDVLQNQPSTPDAKKMLITTCEKMQQGGIYDHLGGGFHRYSVDRYWHIPHFEKMLYDNGQLATVYAEAYALTKRDDFRRTLEGILDFVSRELTSSDGGFYSSLDAESEGEEGKFYRWTIAELKSSLSPTEFDLFAKVYRINEPPNFEQKYYAPQLKQTLAKSAAEMSLDEQQLDARLKPIREKLFKQREKRIRPLLDTKILTAWNGLMIRGYADAGRILDKPAYTDIATKAANDVLNKAVKPDGRVLRTYTDSQAAKLNGYLIDYACLIDGLIALHRSTGDKQWLDHAKRIQDKQIELFWDEQSNGFFNVSSDHESLIARSKQMSDRAMPSGNSVASANLFYLGEALSDSSYTDKSRKTVLSASATLEDYGFLIPRMLIAANALERKIQATETEGSTSNE